MIEDDNSVACERREATDFGKALISIGIGIALEERGTTLKRTPLPAGACRGYGRRVVHGRVGSRRLGELGSELGVGDSATQLLYGL